MNNYDSNNYQPGSHPTPPPAPGQGNPYQQPQAQWQSLPQQRHSNGLGTTGFVLAIITMFIGWIPYIGWLIWLLAVVFSAIGMGSRPRGLAIAGLIISVAIPILVVLAVIAFGVSLAALTAGESFI